MRRPGALARARLLPVVPVGADSWGGGAAVLRLLSRAGGGDHPPCLGGWGPAPPRLAGQWGGPGGVGSRRGLPAPPLGRGPRFPTLAPLLSSAHSPPACAFGRGRGVTPGGGMRGGPWTAPPAAPSDLNPPSALPEWAMVMGGVMGGAAPILFWCAAVHRPQAWSACRSSALVWVGSRRLGALGRAVCRSSRIPPPRRRGPFWGRGGVPLAPGGRRVAPVAFKLGGGSRGGGWGGRSAAPRPPAPSGVGLPSVVFGAPLRGILVPWELPGGCGRRARPGRPPMGQCGGGGREGGGTPPPWFAPPPSPGRPLKGPLCLRRAGGSPGALVAAAVPPHPRCSGLFGGGCGAAVSSVCFRPLLGLRGRGGEWGGASGPLAPPSDGRRGAAWWSRPRGPAVGWGVALFPRPPLHRAGPSCRLSLGSLVPPAVAARRWPAGGGREG